MSQSLKFTHQGKEYKYVNQKTVGGKVFTLYRHRVRHSTEVSTIVLCDGKVKEIDLKDWPTCGN